MTKVRYVINIELASLVRLRLEFIAFFLLLVVIGDVRLCPLLGDPVALLLVDLLLLDERFQVLLHLIFVLLLLDTLLPDLILQALGFGLGDTAFLLHLFFVQLW